MPRARAPHEAHYPDRCTPGAPKLRPYHQSGRAGRVQRPPLRFPACGRCGRLAQTRPARVDAINPRTVKVRDTPAAMRTIVGVIAVATATAWAAAPADAQSYPSRPINMIVPFPPGGNTDIMARALQNEISRRLGQTVVIVNKGGAAGTLGMIELARAAPDGYTIALTPNNPLTAQPHLQKLPYAMDSFRYVCLTYYAPYVLIAGPQAPFKTFEEFVSFARAKPENLIYGHAGVASQPHLGML